MDKPLRAIDGSIGRSKSSNTVVLDESSLTRIGVLAPSDQRSRQAAQYRAVKRQLIDNVKRSAAQSASADRLIMVTSALAGEGKTFTSINLALSLARERDYSVLLVDGDVVKPTVSRLLGIDGLPGLLDAARDDSERVEKLIVESNVRGLAMLPAGTFSHDATEDLASANMGRLATALLGEPKRIVLVDSPPLLLTTESLAIAEHVGQVIVVVDAQSTPQRAVLDAIEKLGERAGVQLVLNRVSRSVIQNYYYGYGYDQLTQDDGDAR